MLPALFLAYLQQWHRQAIPYTYQDQAMNPQEAHSICEATDPVKAFCHNAVLWGDLQANPLLIAAMQKAYQRVEHFMKVHTQ
jgi:D-arabinitol 4-dehydrogenase